MNTVRLCKLLILMMLMKIHSQNLLYESFGMLIECNTARFHGATQGTDATAAEPWKRYHVVSGLPWLAAVCFCMAIAGFAVAQNDLEDNSLVDLAAPKVDWTDAQRSFSLVEEWVRSGTVPRANLPAIPVTGAIGVKVTLRTAGYTLGQGQAMRSDLEAATDRLGPAVDLVPLLTDATRAALAEVRQSLADARLKAVMDQLLDPADARARVEQVGAQLLVDLQIGHNLQTIRVLPDAPPPTVFGRFAFDAQGLRMLPPGQATPDAIVWPASALARNIQPVSQINGLLATLDLGAESRQIVARPDGPVLQRFDVLHRVRPSLDQAAVQLIRGNVPVTRQAINVAELGKLSQRIFAHLNQRFVTDAVRGTYHPTTGRYDPLVAEPREIAFAAYAIQRYRNLFGDDASELTRSATRRGAEEVTRIGDKMRRNDWATFNPAVASLVMLTLLEAQEQPLDIELVAAMNEQLMQTITASISDPGSDLPRPVVALATAAISSYARSTDSPETRKAALLSLNRLTRDAEASPEILSLYWLALADETLGAVALDDENHASTRAKIIGDLVDKLIQQQVIEPPDLGPDDVLGGFVLQKIAPGAPPTPDWRTSPLLGFLAVSMRDERITADRDSYGWLLTASLAARFVAQLTMDRPSLFYVRGPEDALGGVRLALWDNTLAIEPSAASLLAIVELRETIAALEEQARQ